MVTGLRAELEVRNGTLGLSCALAAEPGEVVALLGPNGAGKSTALRALAGLIRLDGGRIVLGGSVLADAASGRHLPPQLRQVGVVFQDYLLFPHLSLLDNVAFGLRAGGTPTSLARDTAAHWLRRFDLTELAGAKPRAISGGQAQRVALARALATEPALLLLDEPLAALDARTRLTVRSELRRHLAEFAGPSVVITHDPVDAAVLADRLVVIESGRVVQIGTPREVARRPRTDYVARLAGLNLLAGVASEHAVSLSEGGSVQLAAPAEGPVHVVFRPAAVSLFTSEPHGSPRNLWRCTVRGLEPHGEGVRVELAGDRGAPASFVAEITAAALHELGLRPGARLWAAVKASDVETYPQRQPAQISQENVSR